MPLSPLESRLRYEFRNAELLRQALTHRSHSASHNERLEFLGDSVLNCAVAALLFQRFGKLDEGDLSRVRANLVKQQSLYEIAQALNIAEGLRLGEGELRSGGFRRPSILADAFEAILGAIFLDGGFEAAQTVIKRLYVPILDHIDPRTLGKDSKTLLQEYLQGHKIALPTYTVVATHGAAHNQQFEVECTVPKLDVKVSGSGASRRAAEQAAAKKALEEVMALAPAMEVKGKRSRGSRAAKQGEPDIVPGVKGVQAALDLRAPDRGKLEKDKGSRGDADKSARASAEAKAAQPEAADRAMPAAPPPAMIRAAHIEHKPALRADAPAAKVEAGARPESPTPQKAEGPGKSEAAAKAEPVAGKPESAPPQKAEGGGKGEATAKPETATAKPETATAKPETATAKPETATAKPDAAAGKPDAAAGKPDASPSSQHEPEGGGKRASGGDAELVSDIAGAARLRAAEPDHS
ncbi:RNAse III [Trinickia symbiotica]|uniref:Ribonuclease 3 n=1 Tax=Trinickia symbiotica TaxID=863227 RepID=A0A2N7X1Z0_9BURK|nr:ribonuclease III [Trinickia symbiotica]PMS35634.1 ribonuclease III [Trinickia symbiotica]PPK47705.1 RNAse III [Trinickia symbiotica]